MLVELDIFSGRPNPRWELDEPATRELLRLQSGLGPSRWPAPEPPALGYRGFLYSDSAGAVRAYRGHVQTARAVLGDPTYDIERYLLDRLPAEYTSLRDRIAAEITRSDRG